MLNSEQTAYIDTLKRDYPHIDEATLRETLKGAAWSDAEIAEALARFSGAVAKDVSVPVIPAPQKSEVVPQEVIPKVVEVAKQPEIEIKAPISDPLVGAEKPKSAFASVAQNIPAESGYSATPQKPKPIAPAVAEEAPKNPVYIALKEKEEKKAMVAKTEVNEPKASPQTATVVSTAIVPTPKTSSILKKALISLGVLLGFSALAAGGYYFVTKTNIFTPHKLTNETIFATIFTKLGEIERTGYKVSFLIKTNPRADGAVAFGSTEELTDEDRAKYQRDQDRIRDIAKIKKALDQSRISANYEYTKPYPATLSLTGIRTADALGKPYVYTRSVDGTGYTLAVTFETLDAIVALENNSYSLKYEKEDKINGTTITFDQNDYIADYMFDGKPQKPRILGLFDISEIEGILPEEFSASLASNGTIDKSTDKPLYGKFGLQAEVAFGDARFIFDAEGLKHEQDYYGIVHKLPAFFGPYSKLRETWVHVTEEDLQSYGYDSYINEMLPTGENDTETNTQEYGEQVRKIIELADKFGLLVINGEGTAVTIGSENYTKYTLSLVPEKFLPFYEEAVVTLASYEHPLIEDNSTTREYLKSEDAQDLFTYLKDNFSLTILIDTKGFPAQFDFNLRYVPTNDAKALSEKQIDTTFTLAFTDINKPVSVTPPENARPLDDVMAEITGKSKQEILLERQEQNINKLRSALDRYYEWSGTYPAFLEDLKKTRKEVTRTSSVPEDDYTVLRMTYNDEYEDIPFLKHIPSDVFLKAPYDYTSRQSGMDYELGYTIQLPPFSTETNPRMYYTYDTRRSGFVYNEKYTQLLVPKYVEGKNIATKNAPSQATLDTINSDIDELSDGLEKLIGSNPKKSDTDGDGFSDSEELMDGSNPLGPGRLKDGYSSSFFY